MERRGQTGRQRVDSKGREKETKQKSARSRFIVVDGFENDAWPKGRRHFFNTKLKKEVNRERERETQRQADRQRE